MGLIELTGFGDLLRMVGVLFWLLVIGALVAAVKLPKTRNGKVTAVLVVVGVFLAFPGRWAWETKQKRDAARERFHTAQAMFLERCKKAGEFIHRTEENVEGILLLKVRTLERMGMQYALDDQYGHDFFDDGYIRSFLKARNDKGFLDEMKVGGYCFVDAVDPKDGRRYRYTGKIKSVGKKDVTAPNIRIELDRNPNFDLNIYAFVLDKVFADDPAPRYGVTYDDISTQEERDYWIAGSSLKVIDLKTNEVMAERIGYMMDPGQGKHGSGVAGWQVAERTACPPRPDMAQTRNFVEKVLQPIPEK